jgi:hypothetical protein
MICSAPERNGWLYFDWLLLFWQYLLDLFSHLVFLHSDLHNICGSGAIVNNSLQIYKAAFIDIRPDPGHNLSRKENSGSVLTLPLIVSQTVELLLGLRIRYRVNTGQKQQSGSHPFFPLRWSAVELPTADPLLKGVVRCMHCALMVCTGAFMASGTLTARLDFCVMAG